MSGAGGKDVHGTDSPCALQLGDLALGPALKFAGHVVWGQVSKTTYLRGTGRVPSESSTPHEVGGGCIKSQLCPFPAVAREPGAIEK